METAKVRDTQLLRRCRFFPYASRRPWFELRTWDVGQLGVGYRDLIGYELRQWDDNGVYRVIFQGDDFTASPLHAMDSDEAVRSLMTFLTLRPGDTEADYFAAYTPEQTVFCEQHAEALSLEVMSQFGEG